MKDQAMTEHDGTTEYADEAPTERAALSPWAVASAVLAAVAFFVPTTGLRLALAVVAIVAGHAALQEINRGLKSGKSFATGGLGLGYIGLVLTAIVIIAGD